MTQSRHVQTFLLKSSVNISTCPICTSQTISFHHLSLFYLSPRRASISSPHRLLTSFSSLFGSSPLRLSLRLKKLEHFSLSSVSGHLSRFIALTCLSSSPVSSKLCKSPLCTWLILWDESVYFLMRLVYIADRKKKKGGKTEQKMFVELNLKDILLFILVLF